MRYREYRKVLRAQSINPNVPAEERYEAQLKLQKLPRDSSLSRTVRRCYVTGRSRGNLRKFGLSRLVMRDLALNGLLPGVTKASW